MAAMDPTTLQNNFGSLAEGRRQMESRMDRVEARLDRVESKLDKLLWAVFGLLGTTIGLLVAALVAIVLVQ